MHAFSSSDFHKQSTRVEPSPTEQFRQPILISAKSSWNDRLLVHLYGKIQ